MSTYWTIECGGFERQLKDWGFGVGSALTLSRASQAVDNLEISMPGPADADPVFAYGQALVFRRDRASASGDPGTFSGGAIYFRGTVRQIDASADPEERVAYRVAGPWWEFEHIVFQQQWKQFNGWSTPGDPNSPPTYIYKTISELFLGQTVDGAAQDTGLQIAEAVQWAISCGVNVQVGSVDVNVNIPTYNVRDITVAEVIVQMMRWSPDAVCWFEYWQDPPAFYVARRDSLSDVTVNPSTDNVRQANLRPRHDLVLPAVIIHFKIVSEVDGQQAVVTTDQKWPPAATGLEVGASVHTIELAGFRATTVSAAIVTEQIKAQSATESERIDWWKNHDALFRSGTIDNLTITVASVKNRAGADVDLAAYPNELLKGQIADWMAFTQEHLTVKAIATYDAYESDAKNTLLQKNRVKEISVSVTGTTGVTGTYTAVTSATEAEGEPAGLAHALWESASVLQYEGRLTLVGVDLPASSTVGVGKKLTIAGLDQDYQNILIQACDEEPFLGRMTLTLGPAAHLGLADLMELLRVNRYRVVYNMPSTRSSGLLGGGQDVALGRDTPKENTTAGLGSGESFAASSDDGTGAQFVVQTDSRGRTVPGATAGYPVIYVGKYTAGGAVDAAFARALADLHDLTGTNKEVRFRQVTLCVDDGAGGTVEKRAWVWMTEPEDIP